MTEQQINDLIDNATHPLIYRIYDPLKSEWIYSSANLPQRDSKVSYYDLKERRISGQLDLYPELNFEDLSLYPLSFAAEPNDLILGLTEMLVADTNPNESLSKMEVEFQGGSRYNGTELILNKHVTVQEDEGLPLAYSSYENMIKYFDYLVENSEIDL